MKNYDEDVDPTNLKRKFNDIEEALTYLRESLCESLSESLSESLRESLSESLKPEDIFKHENKKCRRKSKCASILLRQSLINSWGNMDESIENSSNLNSCFSVKIPDVFNSKLDRRRSTLTESSRDLLQKAFGMQKGGNLVSMDLQKDVVMEVIDPATTDLLFEEVLGEGETNTTASGSLIKGIEM